MSKSLQGLSVERMGAYGNCQIIPLKFQQPLKWTIYIQETFNFKLKGIM